MGKITIEYGDNFLVKLETVRTGFRRYICGKAIYAGAGILADQIRKNLRDNINDPTSLSKDHSILFKRQESTGDLLNSFGISPMKEDKMGVPHVKLGFAGYDRKGVPNQLKARVMESGTSKREKAPFVRPAIEKTEGRVKEVMRQVGLEEIHKIMERDRKRR